MENLLFIVMGILLFVTNTITLVVLIKMTKLSSTINDLSNMVYYVLNKQKNIDTSLDDLRVMCDNTETNTSALSTSIDYIFKEYKQAMDNKIYPTPNLAEMITTTIKEQIAVETILTKNLRIIDKNTVNVIIENTIKTYPHVDQEYIIKKTFSIVESLKTTKSNNNNL